MPYKYFEHKADVGIIGIGKTLEEAFQEGAKALFNAMVDIKKVEPKNKIKIECEAGNEEELFVEFLNRLLAEKDINNMVFSDFKVKIKNNKLTGEAMGEKFNPKKQNVKIEVKAATYSQLKVIKNKEFIAQCVVDV